MPDTSLILFDLNGVLYTYDRNARITHLAATTNRPSAAIKSAIWDSGFEDTGDTGTLDAPAYLHGFGTSIGYDLSEREWTAALQTSVSPITSMLALLPHIRPDVPCAVLTNNNLLVQRHFADLYPHVARYVSDRVCVSAELGARKPDPNCYRRCLVRLGVAPTETWFIDDNASNIEGARKAGLQTHLFRDVKRFAAALRRRRLLSA